MAGPFNPGRKDGVTGSIGRGRGSSGRPAAPRPRSSTGPHNARPRGRGRGGSLAASAGRGRGTGSASAGATGNTSRNGLSDRPSATASSSSPFAGLKDHRGFSSMFGGQTSRNSGAFGMPSNFDRTSVDSDKASGRGASVRPAGGSQNEISIPVEDTSILNRYNERYEELKIERAKERDKAIREGLMADPSQPTSLNQAITPVGTCTSMCPVYERVERIVQKMVDKSEKFLHPSTQKLQYMETKMLKRFRRSAAGYDEQLPSDIRTPATLLQTMNYLTRHVVGGNEPLGVVHKFVWDRTRSIRNDLSVQQLTQEDHVKLAVTCLERIARFHILSLHLLSSPANEEPFDRHQEREQLNNTMLSLMYYYDDNRGRISFANEDEFRAYYIIFSIHDQRPDLEARVQTWQPELRRSSRVQVALELLAAAGNTWEYQGTLDTKRPNAIAQGFYARFFNLIDSPSVSYLMACVAEIYFNHIRQTAIRSIWKGYCRHPPSQQHKNEEWTIDELTAVLRFDDNDQTAKFCEEQDLELKENGSGELCLNWGSRPVDSVAFQPSSEHSLSERYVESKRAGRTLVALILGLNVEEAASLGMIDSSLLSKRTLPLPAPKLGAPTDDDALFVSDSDNEPVVPSQQQSGIPETPNPEMASTPAPSSGNPFRGFPAPGPVNEQKPTSNGFSKPSLFHPADSAKSFSSLFNPGRSTGAASSSQGTFPSPFAANSSLVPSSNAPQTSQSNVPSDISNPLFSITAPPSSFSAQKNDTTTTVPTAFQFNFPTVPQAPQAPAPQIPQIPQIPQAPAAPAAPAAPVTMSAPLGDTMTISDIKPHQSAGLFGDDNSAKPFSSFKTPTFPAVSNGSMFNFSSPKPPLKETDSKESHTEEVITQAPAPPKMDETLVSKQNGISSNSPVTEPAHTNEGPDSLESKTNETSTTVNSDVANEKAVGTAEWSKRQAGEVVKPTEEISPSISLPLPPEPAVVNDYSSSAPSKGADGRQDPLTNLDSDERRRSWIQSLKDAAEKRRQEVLATRKRALDEDQERESSEVNSKAQKVSEMGVSHSNKPSMAHHSVKRLPSLPILDKTQSMISSKPVETEPEKTSTSQVDQDELLLSAARIAAESLRSGPKIFDNAPTYPDSLRSSFSPNNSLSSSRHLSRSQSPSQLHTPGYDIALAPETDLGLGRSLSRTEQRIRLTGGKGLAYKPLDFTPEKSRQTKKYK